MKDEATQMILQGTQLEIEYARDTMPRGVLGMHAAMMEDYLKLIANRRLTRQIMDLKKEKNFFETRALSIRRAGR